MPSTSPKYEQSPPCVNLRERYGTMYRITFDPAYDHKGRHRDNLDPWMMTITCRFGVIWPHGGTTLAVEVDGHKNISAVLVRMEGVRLYQDGDREKTFLFDVSLFDAVALVVQPRKRRVMTEEQKVRAVANLIPFRPAVGKADGEPRPTGQTAEEAPSAHPEADPAVQHAPPPASTTGPPLPPDEA